MFNRAAAVNYAYKWAYSFNPNYYNFSNLGGDCTNFVSQCLYAGKIPMNYLENGWYFVSLSDRAPAWTGVEEFAYFGLNNKNIGFKLTECEKDDIEIADVIQLNNGNRFYHTVLVSKVEIVENQKRIFIAAHDNAVFDFPIERYGAKLLKYYKVSD